MCPEVDSASESEYRCVWLTTYHPFSAETSRKSGALIYPEPLGGPKLKVQSRTGQKGLARELKYSNALSLTSALDGGGWSTPRPSLFTPGNDPVPIVQEGGSASGLGWTGEEKHTSTGILYPDRLFLEGSSCVIQRKIPSCCINLW